jgi:Co/Zn/Cd efflux system component
LNVIIFLVILCCTEVMGALLSVLLIWIVTGFLVVIAVQRVINQKFEIDAKLMLIMAALSVVFNLMYVRFFALFAVKAN